MRKISKSPRINYLLIQLYTYLLSKWNELLFAIATLFIYEDMCGYVNGKYNSTTPTFLPHMSPTTQLINHYFHIFELEYKYKIHILSSMNPLSCLKYFQTWRIIQESLNTLIFIGTTARDKCNGGPTTENWGCGTNWSPVRQVAPPLADSHTREGHPWPDSPGVCWFLILKMQLHLPYRIHGIW